MKRISIGLFLTAMVLLPAGTAKAQYAEDALRFSQTSPLVSGRTLGMGNVGVGLADEYSALFTNPAGLAQLRSYEFSIDLNRNGYSNTVSYFGTKTPSDNTSTVLGGVGLVYPVPTSRGSLTFAFGYGRVADYTTIATIGGFNPSSSVVESLTPGTSLNGMTAQQRSDFLANDVMYQLYLADLDSTTMRLAPLVHGGVQQSATVLEAGGMNSWSFGGAMDIARDLSLGVSLNFQSGSYSYDRTYAETDPTNLYNSYIPLVQTDLNKFTWESSITSDLNGFNALFGVMYRQKGRMRIGAAVRTPTTYEISESFTDTYASQFKNGDVPPPMSTSGTTNYKVVTPPVISLGASVEPTDWLLLSGDAEYTDWRETHFETDNPDLIAENRFMKTSYFRDTWNLRGGAEVTIWSIGLKLRGGIISQPSPFKADASIANRNPVMYTAGVGYVIEDIVTINVAYRTGSFNTLRDNYSLSNIATPARTSEAVDASTINVSLSYRF